MKVIWKERLEFTDTQIINMPSGAKPLATHALNGEPFMWAMIPDPNAEWEPYIFAMIATGKPIEQDLTEFAYLGTTYTPSGGLVFHIYWKRGEG